MIRKQILIYAPLIVILTSFSVDKLNSKSDFEIKVDSFLKKLDGKYNVSSERFSNSKLNENTLEKLKYSTWSKTVTYKCKNSFRNHYKQKIYQRFYLGFHEYDTKEKCDTAFDKVMNCLGTDCQKITWGDGKYGLKTTPFIYVKTEKQIVFCKIHCEHTNAFWEEFKKQIEQEFKTEKFKIIIAGCGGPLIFKKSND